MCTASLLHSWRIHWNVHKKFIAFLESTVECASCLPGEYIHYKAVFGITRIDTNAIATKMWALTKLDPLASFLRFPFNLACPFSQRNLGGNSFGATKFLQEEQFWSNQIPTKGTVLEQPHSHKRNSFGATTFPQKEQFWVNQVPTKRNSSGSTRFPQRGTVLGQPGSLKEEQFWTNRIPTRGTVLDQPHFHKRNSFGSTTFPTTKFHQTLHSKICHFKSRNMRITGSDIPNQKFSIPLAHRV